MQAELLVQFALSFLEEIDISSFIRNWINYN